MSDPHNPQPPAVPGGLTTEQEGTWRQVARPDHADEDKPFLRLFVKWASFAEQALTLAAADPGDLGKANSATTATVNMMRLAELLALGPIGRKKADVRSVKPKPVGRPKTMLDDLHPTKLLSGQQLEDYQKRQAQMDARPGRTVEELRQLMKDMPTDRINGGERFVPTITVEQIAAAREAAAKGGK